MACLQRVQHSMILWVFSGRICAKQRNRGGTLCAKGALVLNVLLDGCQCCSLCASSQ